jgi:choline dehydrogenase
MRENRRHKYQEVRPLAFGRQGLRLEAPNFYGYSHGGPDFTPENAARFKPPAACWSLSRGMRPNSRGTIHLTGPDPTDPVSIDANYLSDPQDLEDLIAGLSMAREIGNSSPLPFHGTRSGALLYERGRTGAILSRRA